MASSPVKAVASMNRESELIREMMQRDFFSAVWKRRASWNMQSVSLIGLPPLIRGPWSSCNVYWVRIFDTESTSRFLGFLG